MDRTCADETAGRSAPRPGSRARRAPEGSAACRVACVLSLGNRSETRSKPRIAPPATNRCRSGRISSARRRTSSRVGPLTTSRYRTSGAPSASRNSRSWSLSVAGSGFRLATSSSNHGRFQENPATTNTSAAATRQRPVRTGRVHRRLHPLGNAHHRGRNPERQHPVRHRTRDQDAHHRQHAELSQSREIGEEERHRSAGGGEDGHAQRRPDTRARLRHGLPGAQLRQQETGIVDGLSQQRRAEAQRDAVYGAKPRAHGDDARNQAGNGRQKAQQDDRHRPIHPEQDAEDQHNRRDRQPGRIGRDQRPARNGHCSRARIAHLRAAVVSRRGEGAFDDGNRALLALEVPARRLRLGDKQRGVRRRARTRRHRSAWAASAARSARGRAASRLSDRWPASASPVRRRRRTVLPAAPPARHAAAPPRNARHRRDRSIDSDNVRSAPARRAPNALSPLVT